MKFVSIYSFMVFDEIKNGKAVYALDRKLRRVVLVNNITIEELVAVINSDKEESTRYEFWYEETEAKEENENA